jgi:hypothetical protein
MIELAKILALVSCYILLISFMTNSANAISLLTKEYKEEVTGLVHNDLLYSFELKLLIDTEENGEWVRGTNYQILFILRVNFINYSYFDALNFSSYGLNIEGCDLSIQHISWTVNAIFGKAPYTISYPREVAEFRVYVNDTGTAKIKPVILMSAVNSHPVEGMGWVGAGDWWAEEPIYIQVKEVSNYGQILLYFFIFSTVVFLGTTIYFARRKPRLVEQK